MARVLITGGTGFVGSHAVEEFVRAGWTVRLLIRNPRRLIWSSDYPIETVVGVLTDDHALDVAVKDCDVVVHCAALTKARFPAEYYEINAAATGKLVHAARTNGVRRFVFCSTQAAAGPSDGINPTVESDSPQPISDYGRSKLEGERFVCDNSGEMQWIILRPPSVLGPRDEQFVPLFRAVARYGVYPKFGSGEQQYSYIGVQDLTRALRTAAEADMGINNTYFVANPDSVRWKDIAEDIARLAGRNVRPIILSSPLLSAMAFVLETIAVLRNKPALLNREKIAEIMAPAWVCSSEKFRKTMGFACESSREDVLRTTYEAYRSAKLL